MVLHLYIYPIVLFGVLFVPYLFDAYGRISSRLQVLINLLCLQSFYPMFLGMMIDPGGD